MDLKITLVLCFPCWIRYPILGKLLLLCGGGLGGLPCSGFCLLRSLPLSFLPVLPLLLRSGGLCILSLSSLSLRSSSLLLSLGLKPSCLGVSLFFLDAFDLSYFCLHFPFYFLLPYPLDLASFFLCSPLSLGLDLPL